MDFLNLPRKEQFDTMNILLSAIASGESDPGAITLKSWKDVQMVVRMGLARKYFKIGDQLVAKYGEQDFKWDIIGIDHDKPADENYKHSLTIQAHDCLMNVQFDPWQALYYADSELSPGTYNFEDTIDEDHKQFTLTNAVPSGGHIVLNENRDQVTTYSSASSNESIETASVTAGTSGTELTEINNISRRYGSNNYIESAIRQWMNSKDESFSWEPKTIYARKPTGSPYDGAGFLHDLDDDLSNVIGPVEKQVARNTVTDDGGQDEFEDYVFLISRLEAGFGSEGTTTGESVYEYYDGISNSERIKFLDNSARSWWLRSPNVSTSLSVRRVNTSGAVNYHYARHSYGFAPACCIY